MKTALCSHTVQVPKDQTSKRRYRIKTHKLGKMSAQEKVLVAKKNLDWFEGREFTAKNEEEEARYHKIIQSLTTCGVNLVHLETDAGEIKLARIHCNNEFCPICGQNGSALHEKRAGRAYDRLICSPLLGSWVFTLPDEISKNMPEKEVLNLLSKSAWEICKKYFNTVGGVVRTHLMGEKGSKLHIHFNVLFPLQTTTGVVSSETLAAARAEWAAVVNETFKTAYDLVDSFYNFAIEDGKKVHKTKYVFRPVVTPDKFCALPNEAKEYIVSLKGWHNTRWFGKLANSQYKKYFEEIKHKLPEDYVSSAPISGEKYYYMGIISQRNLYHSSFQDSDGKFHQIAAVDNDVFVDPETMAFLKRLEKYDPDRKILIE